MDNKKRIHRYQERFPLSNTVEIRCTVYNDKEKFRCLIKIWDHERKVEFYSFTKRGASVSELREYYAKTGKAKALELSKGLIDDGRITPGVYFSLYYELHNHSFADPQIKNVSQDAKNTILENILAQIGDELLINLTPELLTEYFENCAKDMTKARNTARENQQDNSKWFNACISIFRPIFQYAVLIKQIKENPIDIIERKKYMNPGLIITKRLSRMVLSTEEEAKLFERIANGLYNDDRYFALLLALVLAISPQELSLLKYGSIKKNESFPAMTILPPVGVSSGDIKKNTSSLTSSKSSLSRYAKG